MTTLLQRATAHCWVIAVASIGLGAAVLACFTDPFTLGADIVTAIPLVIGLVFLIRRLVTGSASGVARHTEVTEARPKPLGRGALVWLVLLATVVGWELYCYMNTPRSAHPTLSALIDMLTATQAGKSIAFLSWLALGWYLIAR